MSKTKPLWYLAFGAAIALPALWNPLEYYNDMTGPAYYQARMAYIKGDEAQRERIAEVFSDRKISSHEYSKDVFPAFMKTLKTGQSEPLFPPLEQAKTQQQLRADLAMVIQSRSHSDLPNAPEWKNSIK